MLIPVIRPGVAKPWGYLAVLPRISLGLAAKSISRVELNLKNPPSTGFQMKSAPAFKVCLPKVLEMSSLNCHLRWKDCCGTLVLVPNSVGPGKVTSGALMVLSITLFQY